MKLRRGATDLSGILLIDKPAGPTSHDVVAKVRRLTGEKRVGHAGTLDPMATGLLVVLVGPATRLTPYLTAASKTYIARITFGAATDTDDAMGNVTRTCEVPASVGDPKFAVRAVAKLVGTHSQVPPAFSALKRDGVTAHRAAREGAPLEMAPREIVIERARLVSVDANENSWVAELGVSKGTYIRAIARDLGESLGCAAHLSGLRRTGSGGLGLTQALTLEELETVVSDEEGIEARFIDPVSALGLPCVLVDDESAAAVTAGRTIAAGRLKPHPDAEELPGAVRAAEHLGRVCVVHAGRLLALADHTATGMRPEVVFAGGVGGYHGD